MPEQLLAAMHTHDTVCETQQAKPLNPVPDLLISESLTRPANWSHKRLELSMRESMNGLEDFLFQLSLESEASFEIIAIEPAE